MLYHVLYMLHYCGIMLHHFGIMLHHVGIMLHHAASFWQQYQHCITFSIAASDITDEDGSGQQLERSASDLLHKAREIVDVKVLDEMEKVLFFNLF